MRAGSALDCEGWGAGGSGTASGWAGRGAVYFFITWGSGFFSDDKEGCGLVYFPFQTRHSCMNT